MDELQSISVLPLFPCSDVEAVAALLRRFLQLDELQRRREQEEEAEYCEEEEGEEDYSENSSDSENKAEEL